MRVAYIDTLTPLRGIAALLVVVFHLRNCVPNLGLSQLFLRGYLWVDFFFLLSGFVLAHVYCDRFDTGIRAKTYGRYLWARISRIYPLHVVMLLAFVCYEVSLILVSLYVFPNFSHIGFEGTRTEYMLLTNLLLIQSWNLHDTLSWNYPAWSISTEMFAYLLFPLLAMAMRRLGGRAMVLTAVALWVVLYRLSSGANGSLDIHYDWGLVRCVAGFGLGMLVHEAYRTGVLAKTLGSDACFVLCVLSTLVVMQRTGNDALVVPMFALLILAAGNNAGRVRGWLSARPLVFLGNISYSIYLVHALVIQVIRKYWFILTGERFGRSFTVAESWAVLIALIVLVVLVSTLTYRYVEVPAMRALRSRFRCSRPPRSAGVQTAPEPSVSIQHTFQPER